jgi:hypothetical protein
MENSNSNSGVIVAIVAIIAILVIIAMALKFFQLYPDQPSNDALRIDINSNIPAEQDPK